MKKGWIPTDEDIQWTRNLVRMLKNGGIWGTSYAIFKKLSNDEFELIEKNLSLPKDFLEFEIEKVRIVFSHLGIKLKGV